MDITISPAKQRVFHMQQKRNLVQTVCLYSEEFSRMFQAALLFRT